MNIAEIDKTETEKIIISVKEFKGHSYIDLRLFFLSDKMEWLPTKKGITLNKKTIESVIKGLQDAQVQDMKGNRPAINPGEYEAK